ncbi:MAG: trehalase-like domain-containing protein, partial [Acidiferrobacterales bacterium]
MYKKISDYGVIGNLHSVALVGLDGSIDWLCLPYIDSPSVFGALLDDEKGGRFRVSPRGAFDSVAEYLPDTNVLRTRFRTRTGIMQVTDFMPVLYTGEGEWEEERQELYRLVEVVRGTVEVALVFEPRFDYARARTTLEEHDGTIIVKGNGERLVLCSTRKLEP